MSHLHTTAATGGAHFQADADGIRHIECHLGDAELLVEAAEGRHISVRQTDGCGDRLTTEIRDGRLVVGSLPRPVWSWCRTQIVLLVPAAYAGRLTVELNSGSASIRGLRPRDLDCSAHSAQIRIDQCQVACELTASAKSGQLTITETEAQTLSLSSASGSVACEHIVCGTFVCSTRSGRQDLRSVHAGHLCRLEACSGGLRFQGTAPRLETDSKSGAQHLTVGDLETADLKAVSGMLDLTVPEGPDLKQIAAEAISGTVLLRLPLEVSPELDLHSSHGRCSCSEAFRSGFHPVRICAKVFSGQTQILPAFAS
ncbi:MAG: DUF4097 domain-containing protein [Clostridia bacterium]|nr:DUF4097 domain-containing protein [Clostridia bacterium]